MKKVRIPSFCGLAKSFSQVSPKCKILFPEIDKSFKTYLNRSPVFLVNRISEDKYKCSYHV